MKKIGLYLISFGLLTQQNFIQCHGGGGFDGGFATGSLLATGITLAATSGNRGYQPPEYFENQRIRQNKAAVQKQINEEKGKLLKLKARIRKMERELEKARNKNATAQELEDRKKDIEDLKKEKEEHDFTIKDLQEELRSIF